MKLIKKPSFYFLISIKTFIFTPVKYKYYEKP